MKVNLYEAGGRLEGGYTIPGMILTGPLLLSGKVSSPSEAIHKQYIDTAITNLDAASFVSGSIATARLPGLTGDVTSNNSSNVVTLNASGVIAGDYTKVTVDAKGRVTAGLSLTEADLPNLSWNKITPATKPTTLTGYGITDGVSTGNGTITGSLTLANNPTDANHAATKAYADANVAGSSKIVSGDIIGLVSNVTPAGFLRCNGGVVSKTTYSALYATVGDTFTGGNTTPGAGRPWQQQYHFNVSSNPQLGTWTAGTGLSSTVGDAMCIVTKNRVYLLGGFNSSTYTNAGYTAPINSDGTLGAWTSTTAIPAGTSSAQVVVTKNRVYILGGWAGGAGFNTTYTAPINADGTLGTWVAGTALAEATYLGHAFVTLNRVYLVGGFNTKTTVQTAPINADGTIGTWSIVTALPIGMHGGQVVVTNNRVYLFASNAAFTAPINTDGTIGEWATATNLPTPVNRATVHVLKERVWVMGGNYTNQYPTAIFSAPINADGTIGTWAAAGNLPSARAMSHLIITKDKIHLLGGSNGSSYLSTTIWSTLPGGLNDYSPYYDGSVVAVDANSFRLPDYTSYEKTSMYFYIKS